MDINHTILTLQKYQQLELEKNIDFEKFNRYAIVHHSTTIEGSTLTEIETQLLLDEDITPKGKPLLHSLMMKGHHTALLLIIELAKKNVPVNPQLIQHINASVMKNTGNIYQTVFGEIDAGKGMWRKGNVRAGNSYFVSFDKVEILVKNLCKTITLNIPKATTQAEQLTLSFQSHFVLVGIHPFYDGNGRTSRLLMNYIQLIFNLPMGIVFAEDKADYFEALEKSRKEEDVQFFIAFMFGQYDKFLQHEIERFEAMKK
ncbi:MAG: Fic family protein [Chitinophagaceae bacterium]|nr:Fic family protein [Chitinophagaceae bacterium]